MTTSDCHPELLNGRDIPCVNCTPIGGLSGRLFRKNSGNPRNYNAGMKAMPGGVLWFSIETRMLLRILKK